MKFVRRFSFVVLVAAMITSLACEEKKSESSRTVSKSAAEGNPKADPDIVDIAWKDYFHGTDKTEAEFLVRYTVNDIVSMIERARTGSTPTKLGEFAVVRRLKISEPGAPAYQISISRNSKETKDVLDLRGESIWSPDVYAKLLEVHFADAQGGGAESDKQAASTLLANLLEARMPDLAGKDKAVSDALKFDFKSADRHADAALLLLTLALHENNNAFSDIRILMSRATAHLAFAKGISPGYTSDTYLVANALHAALEGNELTALELVKYPAFEKDALQPWRRIISLRATRDYRLSDKAQAKTFLEKSEALRARAGTTTTAGAIDASDLDVSKEARWMAVLTAELDSVSVANIVAPHALEMHVKEARDTYAAAGNKDAATVGLIDLLNQYPAPFFESPASSGRVVGRGLWAQFFQRQICEDVIANYQVYNDLLGVPEGAAQMRKAARVDLKDIWLMAFVRRTTTDNNKDYEQVSDETFELARSRPELVSARNWMNFSDVPAFRSDRYFPKGIAHPHANEWFLDLPLPGTTYQMPMWRFFPSFTSHGPSPEKRAAAALARAPHDPFAIYDYVAVKYPQRNVSGAEIARLLGNLPEYDSRGTFDVVTTLDAKERLPFIKPLAKLDPSMYAVLNGRYKDSLTPDEYAANAEILFKIPEHAVSASNMAPTIVAYYFEQSKEADAKRWAEFGEEVFSASGLEGAALYYEKKKEYEKSIEILQRVDERYNDSGPLVAALERFKKDYNYAGAEALLKKYSDALFPKGKKKVTLASFTNPPTEGVLMAEMSPIMKQYGLQRGVIVVGCNGLYVTNFEQYTYARDTTLPNPFHLIVYQAGRYRELDANPPNRRFGVNMVPYKK